MKYVVKTLGCKANLYDSQLIEGELQKRGFEPLSEDEATDSDEVSLCIVNSCSVTDEADRSSKKSAERLAREYPRARIVFTGCSAEIAPEKFRDTPGLHAIVGNRDKPKFVDLVLENLGSAKPSQAKIIGSTIGYGELRSRHPMDREWPLPQEIFFSPGDLGGESSRTRAFLKVQEGCNSFCTYCIIPYGRGPSRSLRPRQVIEQVRDLVGQGVREVVITGTNIGDYGVEWWAEGESSPGYQNLELENLFRMILEETQLERLRASSLSPVEITPGMVELMERNPRFCPHFHVSLQSPHSRVLRTMKRGYRAEEVEACLNRIAGLSGTPFVGMDVITGFPGETDEEFEGTVEALEGLPWTRLHVFPYSEREGTPATRLTPSVPPAVRKERARVLNELSLKRLKAHYHGVLDACRRDGQPIEGVLIEGLTRGPDGTRNWLGGYSRNYLRALIPVAMFPGGPEQWMNRAVSVMPEQVVVDSRGMDAMFLGAHRIM